VESFLKELVFLSLLSLFWPGCSRVGWMKNGSKIMKLLANRAAFFNISISGFYSPLQISYPDVESRRALS
jgi:hypothetical protein